MDVKKPNPCIQEGTKNSSVAVSSTAVVLFRRVESRKVHINCSAKSLASWVFYCCCNKSPKTYWMKTTQMYYLTSFVGYNFNMTFTGLESRCRESWVSFCRLQRRICLPFVASRGWAQPLCGSWCPCVPSSRTRTLHLSDHVSAVTLPSHSPLWPLSYL